MTGHLITLEGGEGSGKTTNIRFVESLLATSGVEVLLTREPGGTILGEAIRELLLSPSVTASTITPRSELLLMFAARCQHLDEVILPALKQGKWVLCDRFVDASYAYQGGGRGIATEVIQQLEQWLLPPELKVNLTLYLDIPVATSMSRARSRGDLDRFEQEADPFFERVRKRYLELASHQQQRIKVIDASRPLGDVQSDIQREISAYIENSR
ncbi:MAG: dTMP kinase [Gammaproteobacteria bacterium]|nr:dTMP kinase [Gammaproteobacteria bacterium]